MSVKEFVEPCSASQSRNHHVGSLAVLQMFNLCHNLVPEQVQHQRVNRQKMKKKISEFTRVSCFHLCLQPSFDRGNDDCIHCIHSHCRQKPDVSFSTSGKGFRIPTFQKNKQRNNIKFCGNCLSEMFIHHLLKSSLISCT